VCLSKKCECVDELFFLTEEFLKKTCERFVKFIDDHDVGDKFYESGGRGSSLF